MPKFLLVAFTCLLCLALQAQDQYLSLTVFSPEDKPLAGATVELVSKTDNKLVKLQVTDSSGKVQFSGINASSYFFRISHSGYMTLSTAAITPGEQLSPVRLQPRTDALANITVTARKPFIELQPGKTVVNLDASPTSVGTTVMEALEKMPGITVDKDGNIAIKGRPGVMVMIDGKQTYLDASQLATMLNGMSSSQLSQVEIIDQPSSRYDAAGNSGIINLKTKKNLQKGFNGTASSSYSQGVYPKNNNSLQLNYRSGKWNLFTNYSFNYSPGFTRVYANRRYLKPDGSVASILEQFSYLRGSGTTHNFRGGVDYTINARTSVALTFSGLALDRSNRSNNPALWMNAQQVVDSSIITTSELSSRWTNAGGNFNIRHAFSGTRELTADVDVINYRIRGRQYFENILQSPNGYTEATRAHLPAQIHILSARTDYSEQLKNLKWEAGLKTSRISTDNLADYERREGSVWKTDLGKTNHFLYNEAISAAYINGESRRNKWTVQAGLRYETTSYDAKQLGNAMQKDSSFSRSYSSLFPTFFTTYAADSNNSFSFTAGRRIDRPAFQKLNPFIIIINKYTYQQGNPFFKPQFTWNMQLSHMYKNLLITSVGYSVTTDYFSQIFPIDTSGLVIYTEGNLGKLEHFTLSMGSQLLPAKWWSLSLQGVFIHKRMEGVIGRQLNATISQVNINFNNQLRFGKSWTGEVSGFYTSRSQNDIQEIVDPAGQLSAGISKAVFGAKGTLRMAVRDIFYTQWMKGNTYFPHATEYFKLTRDTRIGTISFTYRFGKAFKTNKRSQGAAGEEVQRVGNG